MLLYDATILVTLRARSA